ncbi:ABC transporter substrate-binding protein [Endothiovibrio diazotrophicus]
MNRVTVSRLLSAVLLFTILVVAVLFNMAKPRVMILQSYDPNYAWTRDIDVGLHRVVDEWSDYAVSWHYMDTKKHSGADWLRRAGIVARRAIDQADPDVLIAVDDLAQKLAAKYYVDRPGIEIVFAGVNGAIDSYGYDKAKNVTGIYEHKQLKAVKETLLALEGQRPQPKAHPRVLYLLDPSASLARDRPFFDHFDWSPVEYAGSVQARDFDQWQEIVTSLKGRVDYLLVANYRTLPRSAEDSAVPPATEVMGWTEKHSPVPVIGVNVFNVEDGGSFSVGVSPYEQGEVAARMAQRILEEGIHASEIPIRVNQQYVVALNDSAMKSRDLHIPTVYEAFARATANFVE